MKLETSRGTFDTSELRDKANKGVIEVEKCCRTCPTEAIKYPIGYAIPLGTLGNAPNQPTQFKSNFHIIAYTITNGLNNRNIDFEDFNINEVSGSKGHVANVAKELEDIAVSTFGAGWHITMFNVNIQTVLESMCKGNDSIDALRKAMEDLVSIVKSRVNLICASTREKPWKHELIELFYLPLKTINTSFTKLITNNSKTKDNPIGSCGSLIIEGLVFDTYANGLRLLTNNEPFASTHIRSYESDGFDNSVYMYVLKARLHRADESEFVPIRQFCGTSTITDSEIHSGCSERLVYNIINKNYKHWSLLSLPTNFSIPELKSSEWNDII